MNFVTVQEMKRLEALCCDHGVSYAAMMENAGQSAAKIIEGAIPCKGRRVLVLCGKGNNGGDGFVVARALTKAGAKVTVALVCGEPETAEAKAALLALPQEVIMVRGTAEAKALCQEAQVLVDGVFGTGFRGTVEQELAELFCAANRCPGPKFALDIPSGVEADSGDGHCFIRCDLTIALAFPKPAHLVNWHQNYTLGVAVADIGVPNEAQKSFDGLGEAIDLDWFQSHRPQRSPTSHKGTNGRLLVVAGSRQYPGAALLATGAAVRTGVGYVRLACIPEVRALSAGRTPEVIYTPCEETPEGSISHRSLPAILAAAAECDAVVMGCGMTPCQDTRALVQGMLTQCRTPLVLDADGLNVLAGHWKLLESAVCPVLVTPHPGELARLLGNPEAGVHNPFSPAYDKGKDDRVTLLEKGPVTRVTGPDGVTRYSFLGCSGLAKAGSGDVLAGIIGGFAARGLALPEAALCGAYLHGRSAQLAAELHSRDAMLPSQVIEAMGAAFLEAEGCER